MTQPEHETDAVRIPQHFNSFYRSEYSRVLGLAYALAGSHHAAEDIAQEAFLRAHRDWEQVGRYERPDSWVRKVAANLATSRFRKLRSERKALSRLAGFGEPTTGIDLSIEYEDFWREVRRLPRRQGQVVALFYLEDLSIADIASTLDIAEGTVKALLHKARAALAAKFDTTTENSV